MKNYGLKAMVKENAPKSVVGLQGGVVYDMDKKERIVNMLCLGLIQNNFYQDEATIIKASKDIYSDASKNCPEFLAKAAVYARNTVGMKLQPLIALVYLSTLKNKTWFNLAFDKVIKTPKDLFDFMELCRKTGIRKGVGRGVKTAINRWILNTMTEYHACRYGGKISEVLKVTRPVPTEDKGELLTYVSKGTVTDNLKRATSLKFVVNSLNDGVVSEQVLTSIQANGLQMEELKHTFGNLTSDQKKQVFAFFIPKLAYMATVSNLVAIERVYDGRVPKDIVDLVANKLSDLDAYKKSRMLPFRLITARNMTSVREWQRAIERVVTAGVKSLFQVNNEVSTLIAVDTSGSMSSAVTPSLSCVEVASMFGSICTLGIEGSDCYAVASNIKKVNVRTDEVFTLADEIRRTEVGYGTYFGQIMKEYDGQKFVILITDSECADNLESAWNKAVKPQGAKLIVWQLMPYGHRVASPKSKNVVYFQGYSDSLVGTIRDIIEGKGQLSDIESVKL